MSAANTEPGQAAEPAAAELHPGPFFFDSASYEFPVGATTVMGYASGDFAYSKVKPDGPPLEELHPFVHWITVQGGAAGHRSLVLDFEQFNPDFASPYPARDWAESRLALERRAVFYCDRANLHRLRAQLGPLLWSDRDVLFWIPTLDGVSHTADSLSWDIASHWGVYIPAARIWACQFSDSVQSGGNWDSSELFGTW